MHGLQDSVDIAWADGREGTHIVSKVPLDAAYDAVKPLYVEYIAQRTGSFHRARVTWANNALEPDDRLFVAISRTPEGEDSGYVIYTLSTGSGAVDTR